MVRYQIHKWAAFHQWWLDFAAKKNLPLYFFRYEDMISPDPSSVLSEIFAFALGQNSI